MSNKNRYSDLFDEHQGLYLTRLASIEAIYTSPKIPTQLSWVQFQQKSSALRKRRCTLKVDKRSIVDCTDLTTS